jgi:hypothetical protein
MAPLELPKCRQCHDAQSGIRAELRRVHASSIVFLAGHGEDESGLVAGAPGWASLLPSQQHIPERAGQRPAMPIDDEPLTKAETLCLSDWLFGRPVAAACTAPRVRARPARRGLDTAGSVLVVRREASRLQATVRSSLHDVVFDGIEAAGGVRCAGRDWSACRAEIAIDLGGASSGLHVRDEHMRALLHVGEEPVVRAVSESFDLARVLRGREGEPLRVGLALTIAGRTATVPVVLRCRRNGAELGCRLSEASWSVRDFGIEPPRFLGMTVDPVVRVAGVIVARGETDTAARSNRP